MSEIVSCALCEWGWDEANSDGCESRYAKDGMKHYCTREADHPGRHAACGLAKDTHPIMEWD